MMLGWANHFEPPLGAPNTLSLYAANANVNRKGPGISRPFAVSPAVGGYTRTGSGSLM